MPDCAALLLPSNSESVRCAEKNIVSDIELIPVQEVNAAYERMVKGDVEYRFVLDMKTL